MKQTHRLPVFFVASTVAPHLPGWLCIGPVGVQTVQGSMNGPIVPVIDGRNRIRVTPWPQKPGDFPVCLKFKSYVV